VVRSARRAPLRYATPPLRSGNGRSRICVRGSARERLLFPDRLAGKIAECFAAGHCVWSSISQILVGYWSWMFCNRRALSVKGLDPQIGRENNAPSSTHYCIIEPHPNLLGTPRCGASPSSRALGRRWTPAMRPLRQAQRAAPISTARARARDASISPIPIARATPSVIPGPVARPAQALQGLVPRRRALGWAPNSSPPCGGL
jgi:hypothetical protein